MSARQAKNQALNPALNPALENGNIESLANAENVKTEGVVVEETTSEASAVIQEDRIARIKQELKQHAKKDKNKSMTFLISPENAKRLSTLKVKGQKSELINKLLDMYFEE